MNHSELVIAARINLRVIVQLQNRRKATIQEGYARMVDEAGYRPAPSSGGLKVDAEAYASRFIDEENASLIGGDGSAEDADLLAMVFAIEATKQLGVPDRAIAASLLHMASAELVETKAPLFPILIRALTLLFKPVAGPKPEIRKSSYRFKR